MDNTPIESLKELALDLWQSSQTVSFAKRLDSLIENMERQQAQQNRIPPTLPSAPAGQENAMPDKLRLCPFCRTQATLLPQGISCDNCLCDMQRAAGETDEQLIAIWNIRATDYRLGAPLSDEQKEMCSAIGKKLDQGYPPLVYGESLFLQELMLQLQRGEVVLSYAPENRKHPCDTCGEMIAPGPGVHIRTDEQTGEPLPCFGSPTPAGAKDAHNLIASLPRPEGCTPGISQNARLVAAWGDAYAAFKGAFDTPQMRRKIPDEYAQDARKRMRAIDEMLTETAQQGTPQP